jgi:hypothetical protein
MSDYVQVDALGRVGLSADPDALLTVGGRAVIVTEADIFAMSPLAWYDAADLIAYSDGDIGMSWPDRTGNGHGMNPGTYGTGMTFFKTAGVNGRYSISPGGAGAYFSHYRWSGSIWVSATAAFSGCDSAMAPGVAYTVFAVMPGCTSGLDNYVLGSVETGDFFDKASSVGAHGTGTTVTSEQRLSTRKVSGVPLSPDSWTSTWGVNVPTPMTSWRIQMWHKNGATVTFGIDDFEQAITLADYHASSTVFQTINLIRQPSPGVNMAANFFAEILVFGIALSLDDRKKVRAYLSNKYGLFGARSVTPYDLLSISDTPVASADYVNVTSAGTVGLSTQPTTPVTPTAQLQMAQRAVALDILKVDDGVEAAADYVQVDHEGLVGLSATPDGTALLEMKERTVKQDFITLKDTV